jgi:sec-independent protein translocase protein TatC
VVLVRSGIVSIEKLKESRPYVVVGAFIVAAIFTPPDILSQFMLAVPLCILYEAGLLVAGVMGRSAAVAAKASDAPVGPE